ncbi:UDP-N-acetylenolpyruvoylglucosamine reductase [Candidatus Nomurabacteria bacterium RIFCSPHIGHO2_01_FULL_38_19]|uniref:UDP-N-acetylenolpyruvoylglucosamine reductase n=1 Tax=Candidatus Nomurabacteria bacterium RIFCSPHIGHO2_01_FULL_38_19 TaxID=1801732 RepID=A0A1F6URK6_9BACT|nr:MAG: UDP-N-acetylenolpyruvoylglucosamine reductase [Candidatus Nomurabacteria bacterium RIFCSPHIGHO2_01_FULL_38_19]
MQIYKDCDLTKLNTLGISARAKFFVEIHSEPDLKELFNLAEFKQNKKIFLGGGSNVLFTKDFDGIIILNKLKGIEILEENIESVVIKSMSGEVWHDLVSFVVDRGLWGIENLSLIPGTVGGAPVQNIGAYGTELKNVLENVEAYNIIDGSKKIFTREECEFGYRDSIFKNSLKEKYFISAITLRLSKAPKPNLSYKILSEFLEKNPPAGGEIKNFKASSVGLRSKDISDAVTSIRRSKLPDPAIIGNAGSFFKNVFVEKKKLQKLLQAYPTMPYFEENKMTKIPSAWLIEQCGWKGKKIGNTGVHEKHALVLVNYGGASGEEVKNLAEQIVASVYEKFGLKLTPEVNLL